METSRIGKNGTLVIPARLRRRYGLSEGSLVILDDLEEGLRLRPAMALPLEIYSDRRKAELLLNNAVDAADYRRVQREVRKLGLDPTTIAHKRP